MTKSTKNSNKTNIVPKEPRGGNTQSPLGSFKNKKSVNSSNSSNSLKKQIPARIEHFFTWFGYNEESEEFRKFMEFLEYKCSKYAFQEEECPSTKKMHLQGIIKLHRKERDTAFGLSPQIHWEKPKDSNAAFKYCLKEYTRKGKQWTKGIPLPIKDPLAGKTLKPFQQEIVDLCKTPPDDRSIYWYWEATGKVGKTALAKHMCLKDDKILFLNGGGKDIKYAVAQHLATKGEISVAIFSFPRTVEEFVSYQTLEEIKDGIFFSSKYEAGMSLFNAPHVVCFANFPPDQSKLSRDRWEVRCIQEENDAINPDFML